MNTLSRRQWIDDLTYCIAWAGNIFPTLVVRMPALSMRRKIADNRMLIQLGTPY